jgi:hypothetical protein
MTHGGEGILRRYRYRLLVAMLLAAPFGLFYTAVVVAQLVVLAQSGSREAPRDS